MHLRSTSARAVLAALALCAVVALPGCARQATRTSPAAASDDLIGVKPAPLTQMTPADKASKIATSFPVQVPVAVGRVTRGEAQGDSAWDYQLVVPGKFNQVMRWYLEAYLNAEWSLSSRTTNSITLEKNAAQSKLVFDDAGGSPAATRVTAILGVGAPVLQTQ